MKRKTLSVHPQFTRRQALQAAVAATVFSGFSLAPFRRIPAQSSRAQGLALCIGLNQVDPRAYAGWNGLLSGCEKDANAMVEIAKSANFYDVKPLIGAAATIENVRSYIAWAANDLRPGDIFMLSCSSHGGYRTDTNGDETDGRDETWCLYDGQWVDDDRYAMFGRFARGVRVLVIGDMCHSGTSERAAIAFDGLTLAENHQKALDKKVDSGARPPTRDLQPRGRLIEEFAQSITNQTSDEMTKRLAAYRDLLTKKPVRPRSAEPPKAEEQYGAEFNMSQDGKAIPNAIRAMPEPLANFLSDTTADSLPPTKGESRSVETMRASGILLAACQDHQTALDGRENGLFTQTLLAAWQAGRFQGSYDDLFSTIQQMLRNYPEHQPNREYFGDSKSLFNRQRPFTVA